MSKQKNSKVYTIIIWVLSILIPLVVALLIYTPQKLTIESGLVFFLPHLNALLNFTTSVLLLLALYFIKQNNIIMHKRLMSICFVLGSIFLLSYVIYHASADSTYYGDANGSGVLEEIEKTPDVMQMRTVYFSVLISHIILAAVVVPFVLFAFYFALTDKIDKHKKIVKFTYPIWLYVSITGVVVYLMISPYYMH